MPDLERAWRFDAALQERTAQRVEHFELGAALLSPDLPRVYDANFVRLDRGYEELAAEELVALADSHQAGLAHRKVVMPGGRAGRRLAGELGSAGWAHTETVVMRYEGALGDAAADAELVDPRALRGARAAAMARNGSEVARQVADYTERLAAACDSRAFAAFADGGIASFCVLLEEGGVAEIDEVTTLAPFRRRGLGNAVVRAALAASVASGHELTYVVAAAGDWPRGWYERLGFRELGRRWELYRV
jgi:ribosomal protein S18 acetylase RimI-like enzyme